MGGKSFRCFKYHLALFFSFFFLLKILLLKKFTIFFQRNLFSETIFPYIFLERNGKDLSNTLPSPPPPSAGTPWPPGGTGPPWPREAAGMKKIFLRKNKKFSKTIKLRRPGIEPGSQEWESCMIPLHQRRRYLQFE